MKYSFADYNRFVRCFNVIITSVDGNKSIAVFTGVSSVFCVLFHVWCAGDYNYAINQMGLNMIDLKA